MEKRYFNRSHLAIGLTIIAFIAVFVHHQQRQKLHNVMSGLKTVQPTRKTIAKTIDVSGGLEIKDNLKIGSLVAGIVQQILVTEGSSVAQGQVLAIINNGKDDCDVQALAAEIEQIEALLNYQKRHFERIEQLFAAGFGAQDELEQEQSKFLELKGRLKMIKARHKKACIEYQNTHIKAPKDGIIVAIRVTTGEAVTATIDATVLFELASNLSQKQAVFEVEENDIASIKLGQKIMLETLIHDLENLSTTVENISLAPRNKNGIVFFKVYADINDPENRLRPGTSINGLITCAQAEEAITLPAQAFYLQTADLEAFAKKHQLNFIKLAEKTRGQNLKTAWRLANKSIEQVAVQVGLDNQIEFEVVTGISPQDLVIIDVDDSLLANSTIKRT